MMNGIIENVRLLGPMFAAAWLLTIVSVLWRPQRFLNSLLLISSFERMNNFPRKMHSTWEKTAEAREMRNPLKSVCSKGL